MLHFNHCIGLAERNDDIMAKGLNGKELGTGIRQRKDGRYEARATVNGVTINIYGMDLKQLKREFHERKELARMNMDVKRQQITLNEWFEEWFTKYKVPTIL